MNARVAAVLCVGVAIVLATSHTAREPLPRATSPQPQTSVPGASEDAAELRVARAFLTGYLAYLSGREPAGAIQDATSELSRALTLQRRVIPPTAAAREARIVSLTPASQLGRPGVVVLINDGELASYQLTLLLARKEGRLLVTRVEGA